MSEISKRQLGILRSAIYSGHFYTTLNSKDNSDCEALVKAGLMRLSSRNLRRDYDATYVVTNLGLHTVGNEIIKEIG